MSAYHVVCIVSNLLLRYTSLLINLPDVESLLRICAQCRQKSIVFGTERHWHPWFVFVDLVGADYFLLFQSFGVCLAVLIWLSIVNDVINRADGRFVTLLSHGKSASIVRDRHRCDAFCAFDARICLLCGVFEMVHNDVVPSWVDHLIVIKEKDVVCDIRLESGDELGLECDGRVIGQCGLTSCLSTSLDHSRSAFALLSICSEGLGCRTSSCVNHWLLHFCLIFVWKRLKLF